MQYLVANSMVSILPIVIPAHPVNTIETTPLAYVTRAPTHSDVLTARVDQPLVHLITDTDDIVALAEVSNHLQLSSGEHLEYFRQDITSVCHLTFP